MKKIIRLATRIFSTSSILASLVFGWLWWTRFNLPYNSEGRFFDPETSVTYDEDGHLTYLILALCLFGAGLNAYILTIISKRKMSNR